MVNGVPLIMTNMLNLGNRGLLDLDDAGQVFQMILLGLNRIPVSVLFNTGPRQEQDGDHQNRWIPTKISAKFGLALSQKSLTVRPTYLEYAHSYRASDQGVMVYTMKSILPLKAETHVSLGSPNDVYAVQPSVATSDQFNVGRFALTYLIVEHSNPSSHEGRMRGACFYGQVSTQDESKRVRHMWKRLSKRRTNNAESPNLIMTFYCALRLHEVTAGAYIALDVAPTCTLDRMKSTCNLRIRFGVSSPWLHDQSLLLQTKTHYQVSSLWR